MTIIVKHMNVKASQITSNSAVSTICWGAHNKKHQRSMLPALCEGNPPLIGGFPSQRITNTESVSMQWWHHDKVWVLRACVCVCLYKTSMCNLHGSAIGPAWVVSSLDFPKCINNCCNDWDINHICVTEIKLHTLHFCLLAATFCTRIWPKRMQLFGNLNPDSV